MAIDPSTRLLNLAAALLNTTRFLTLEELVALLPGQYDQPNRESARRMFERDKKALIGIGVDVEVSESPDGTLGYRASRADELEGLDLDLDELAALHLAATSVRIDGDDDDLAVSGLHKVGGTVGAAGAPLVEIAMPRSLGPLFGATLGRRTVTFAYGGVVRELEPHRVELERGHWYVSGFDRTRNAARSFRLDRIEGRVEVGPAGSFEAPERRRRVRTVPWDLADADPVTARVAIDREVAPVFCREYPEARTVGRTDDGGVEVELDVRHPAGLFNVLLVHLDRVELLSSPALRAEFVELLGRLAEVD